MSSHDFESITSGMFQPHVERWYELELDDSYPQIEPNSALGRMGVELNQRYNEATATRDKMGEHFGPQAKRSMDEACERTNLRLGVYDGAYFEIAFVLEQKAADYEGVVARALKNGLDEIDDPNISLGMKTDLARLTREFMLFLDLEDGLHFRDLA